MFPISDQQPLPLLSRIGCVIRWASLNLRPRSILLLRRNRLREASTSLRPLLVFLLLTGIRPLVACSSVRSILTLGLPPPSLFVPHLVLTDDPSCQQHTFLFSYRFISSHFILPRSTTYRSHAVYEPLPHRSRNLGGRVIHDTRCHRSNES